MRYFLPPKTVFPKNYDSDFTLFLVYDTAETTTTSNNLAWSEEIEIEPVGANDPEIWADNGFANISGELFYYDSVEKDPETGKVIKFKNCSRNLAGTRTKNNSAGTDVRGYVIAQHHNQLVDAVINLEKYIGIDDSTDETTLDWKIKKLASTPTILDDHTTPNVIFNFKILENDPFRGTLTEYTVTIDGFYNDAIVNFGDGTSTTNLGPGQHRYPVNYYPDPYVVVTNEKTQVIQSPEVRPFADENDFSSAPDQFIATEEDDPFDIPLPEIPVIPTFNLPTIPTPSNIVNIPPIVFPCLDVNIPSSFFSGISFPSINIPSINVPSSIALTPSVIGISLLDISVALSIDPPVPSVISLIGNVIPSFISFIDSPTIPSVISFVNVPVFSIISITGGLVVSFDTPPSFPVVSFATPTSFPTVNFNVPASFPTISLQAPQSFPVLSFDSGFSLPPVSFVAPPTLSCVVTINCPAAPLTNKSPNIPLYDFPEDEAQSLSIENMDFGIPSEIFLRVPDISDIQIVHDIPAIIRVESPKIPNIKIDIPDFKIPEEIKLNFDGMPSVIELLAQDLPKSISLDSSGLPRSIGLEVPKEFPQIKIDASAIPDKIQVVGIPSTIELIGAPSEIKLVLPEKPEIELVYRGSPIDVKINLDIGRLTGDAENAQCVAIVPCVNK